MKNLGSWLTSKRTVALLACLNLLLLGALTYETLNQKKLPEKPKPTQEFVRTRTIILVDANDNEKIRMDTSSDSSPRFTMFDSGHKPRLTFTLNSDQPKMAMFSSKSNPRLMISFQDDRPKIALLNEKGDQKMSMYLRENGLPIFSLFDNDGKRRVSAEVNDINMAGIWLTGETGDNRLTLTTNSDYWPTLEFYNAKGKQRMTMGVYGNDHEYPVINLMNSDLIHVLAEGINAFDEPFIEVTRLKTYPPTKWDAP